ncbi:hypothetical protein [Maribellus sediminis]|uniref:hypothetical protein n=1 Tax=Maribellus sediminis TaxID=2696285 RepID=UPI001430CED6|nr:hypothetical protein [Maribellus sediminis]
MKTLKFLASCFVVVCFFAYAANAQKNVKTTEYYNSGELVSFQLPGVPELVTGSFEGWWTVWNSKVQWRAKGMYVGDITGTIYYTSNVANTNFMDQMPGNIFTDRATITIQDEYGKVWYTTHYNFHLTVNANGEITSEIWNEHEYFF